jgi:WD40 repeat protein
MCLAHYDGTCVTGQRGSVPLIFTWDAVTGEKKAMSVMDKGAGGLQAVSMNDTIYAAVDMSTDHHVYVFDKETGAQKHKAKGDTNKIYDITINCNGIICTVGKKHVKFWDFS